MTRARKAKAVKVHHAKATHAKKTKVSTKHARKASHVRRHTTAHARHNSTASI